MVRRSEKSQLRNNCIWIGMSPTFWPFGQKDWTPSGLSRQREVHSPDNIPQAQAPGAAAHQMPARLSLRQRGPGASPIGPDWGVNPCQEVGLSRSLAITSPVPALWTDLHPSTLNVALVVGRFRACSHSEFAVSSHFARASAPGLADRSSCIHPTTLVSASASGLTARSRCAHLTTPATAGASGAIGRVELRPRFTPCSTRPLKSRADVPSGTSLPNDLKLSRMPFRSPRPIR
jgi:hypothetical protein